MMSSLSDKRRQQEQTLLRTLKAIKRGANTFHELVEVVGSSYALGRLSKMGYVERSHTNRLYVITELGHKFLMEGVKHDTKGSSIAVY